MRLRGSVSSGSLRRRSGRGEMLRSVGKFKGFDAGTDGAGSVEVSRVEWKDQQAIEEL